MQRQNKTKEAGFKTGILLTNTGTPDAPNTKAVRRYLREFLTDKRVVQIPRLIWLPILYGLVLSLRPKRSAKLYQKIWTPDGSPLRHNMEKIAVRLHDFLNKNSMQQYFIEIGMNYGKPSVTQALENLDKQHVEKIILLPLFPQYSKTTTAASFDRVKIQRDLNHASKIRLIQDYADHPDYIQAVKLNIENAWSKKGKPQHLLVSFHGIPESFVLKGDPYKERCVKTCKLLAEALHLTNDQWTLCFQSRFGFAKWLSPSIHNLLIDLPKKGLKQIDVVCPGFPVDCLETLEEIAIRGKETFLEAGGEQLHYIPALNDSDIHITALAEILRSF